ncbi:hypothetical protein [Sorangium sp. So ce388]|uniref:hypothetical protein n=1 Tax=Sorangium sp. So ce388 TaxID=3133309 RepID=UPI003F5BADDB
MADETSFLPPLLRELVYGIDAWKKPVKVVATSNVAQSGLQTVDGVALAAADEVLCVGQSSAAQNGIFVAATGTWTRRPDASNSERLFEGCRVPVTRGTHAGAVYRLATTGKINVGTTAQTWEVDTQGGDGAEGVVDPDPDTLVLRGPGGEVHGERLIAGGSSAATVGNVALPQNATIYGRVATGGGQNARLIGLSSTSLLVGDQRTTPRIVAPASGDIELASGASDTVFARIRSTTACAQAGDLRFDATTGQLYTYLQGAGEVAISSDARITFHRYTADASAAEPLQEFPIAPPLGRLWTLASAKIVFSDVVIADDTDYAQLFIMLRSSSGSGAGAIAIAATRITGSNATGDCEAYQEVTFTPQAGALTLPINPAHRVSFAISKHGAGTLLPSFVLTVTTKTFGS